MRLAIILIILLATSAHAGESVRGRKPAPRPQAKHAPLLCDSAVATHCFEILGRIMRSRAHEQTQPPHHVSP